MNYEFDQIKKLIKDFYAVTGQQIGFFDKDFNIIAKYPEKRCDFCERIRNTNKGYKACTYSDETLLQEAAKGKTVRARCHAGLLEVCAPIIDDMGISGYLMFGQILYDNNIEEQHESIRKLASGYFSKNEFEKNIKSIRTLSSEYIDSVENIMTACISYIHLSRMLSATKTGLWAQIEYYIERNYIRSFSLEEMADDLGISISSICKTAKKHSNKTLHQLLTATRLKKAKKLLKETEMNINEISYMVGIQDYNYFTKIFKKNEGITPTEYRKKASS